MMSTIYILLLTKGIMIWPYWGPIDCSAKWR